MTHRVQPIRSKIDDIPLSASIECLDPPEQSQFSTHATDLLSNMHQNFYPSKTPKNFGSPEIESQFGTQSIQRIMSGIQTPSNLDSISREIQIPQSITAIHSLQATHSRHNSKDFFLGTGHSPAKNFLNTEKVITKDGQSRLDSFASTLPVRNLRDIDTEKDYESENILKERRTENARKTVSYKNFGIKHDDDQKPLNITPLGQPDLNQVDEAEQTQETEETERRNHHSMPRSEGFSRIEKRALSKNPVIGKMINESSKELDRINKMLENHRQKNATKKMFQDTIENSYAQRNSEKFHPSEIRPMDEGQSGPSEIYLQTDGQENSLENMMAGPQELEPKYSEQLSGDFFTDRLEDHFYKDDIENVLEGELEEEQLERELGLDDLESRRHDDIMMEEEMLFKEERMKGGKKKMNKLQKDFENYRASNPPKGTRTAADVSNKQYVNKISMQNKRNGQTKISTKENYAPPVLNLKPITKKNPTGFHSIDMSNQSIEHPSKKNAKAMNNKDKGSYAKKFLEYKERRKQQNQLPCQTENLHPEGTPQKSSHSSNSERKTQGKRSTYNNREDSLPLTDRSSARKRNLNTPQASARQRSRTQGPGQQAQETKNIQLMRYCDIRNAHKSNQKQTPALQRDSIQPINRLELDRLRENKEDDRKPSSRATPAAVVTNGNGSSVSANLIKPILVISDHKSRRPSIERAQTFRDNNDLLVRAGKKEAEMDIPDYQKEILRGQPINPEEIMRETHQIYSSASSTKNSRVTQESLMKSLKLRQEMFSKAFGGKNRRGGSGQYDFKDYESHGKLGAVGDLGMTAPIVREKKREEEEARIYNKNIEWLNSRQRKLNKMHNQEMEDEMRECTFKPQLLTKELNLKLEYESEINLPIARERNNQGSFSRNVPAVIEQR